MKPVKELKRRFESPTPLRAVKIGQAINHLGTTIQVVIASLQIGDDIMSKKQYFIFVIALAILQWLGTTVTSFATEDNTTKMMIDNAVEDGKQV